MTEYNLSFEELDALREYLEEDRLNVIRELYNISLGLERGILWDKQYLKETRSDLKTKEKNLYYQIQNINNQISEILRKGTNQARVKQLSEISPAPEMVHIIIDAHHAHELHYKRIKREQKELRFRIRSHEKKVEFNANAKRLK